jgi:7-cyano-7-deazaguanine synthase
VPSVALKADERPFNMDHVMSQNVLRKAVVLVSGGMDSAVTIALAREQGYQVHVLSVAYGQRHNSELAASERVSRMLGSDIPVTYVPARNTIMLSIALGWAEVLGSDDIWCGVNAVDYSGYPDCRPAFIEAFETLANVATKAGVEGAGIRIHAPLMRMSKADIAREGLRLGVDFSATVSCYNADADGRACGHCDACRLRAQGFREAELPDPTRYV